MSDKTEIVVKSIPEPRWHLYFLAVDPKYQKLGIGSGAIQDFLIPLVKEETLECNAKYLGGFHNTVKRNFLRRVNTDNPNIGYFHIGDIAAGGFNILQHLNRETGMNFKCLNMDVATLEKYKTFTKKLTENDQKRLKKMLNSEFDDVIRYMLKNNCKLEQEVIDTQRGLV